MSIYYGTVPLGTVLDSTLAQEIISKVIHLLDLVFLGEPIVFLPIMLAVGVRSSSSYRILSLNKKYERPVRTHRRFLVLLLRCR